MRNNRWFKKLGLACIVMAMGFAFVPTSEILPVAGTHQVEASAVKYQTTERLNLRTGASPAYKVLTTIPKGKQVQYVSKSGTWYKVKYGAKTGYVNPKYLKKVTEAKAPVKGKSAKKAERVTYVTIDKLNLRKGAGVKYGVIVEIPKGKSVNYIAKSGTWFKVSYGSKTGYVNSAYLKKPGTSAPVKKETSYPAPSTKTPGTYVGGMLIVNKKYALPSNYNPGVIPTAQKAVNAMVADAKKQKVYIHTISAFRSYSYQSTLYNKYVRQYGKTKANTISAKPGHSEHQAGLAFDFGGSSNTGLSVKFAGTKEGKWLAAHAHKYGFILRYPKGKEHITGYQFEPWHFRYVGTENATKVKNSGKTLEEYLKIKGK